MCHDLCQVTSMLFVACCIRVPHFLAWHNHYAYGHPSRRSAPHKVPRPQVEGTTISQSLHFTFHFSFPKIISTKAHISITPLVRHDNDTTHDTPSKHATVTRHAPIRIHKPPPHRSKQRITSAQAGQQIGSRTNSWHSSKLSTSRAANPHAPIRARTAHRPSFPTGYQRCIP